MQGMWSQGLRYLVIFGILLVDVAVYQEQNQQLVRCTMQGMWSQGSRYLVIFGILPVDVAVYQEQNQQSVRCTSYDFV